jgi:hypothetical protein
MHAYEIRPRKDHRGVDLISDALPFGRLWSRSVRMQLENKRILEASRIARAHWVRAALALALSARAFPAAPIQQRQRSKTRGKWPHIYGS